MSFEFDEAYYLKSKLAQLKASDTQYTDWTTDQVKQAILDAGMTVEGHYKQYSLIEGTSANPYFNTVEYLEAKVKQLNSTHEGGKTDWTVADVVKAFQDAGFTSAEDHYDMYGCHEMDATGKLINPSNAFDANAYVEAKLAQLQQTDPENWEGKTAADVLDAIVAAGMTPIEHFEEYGKAEGAAADPAIDMVQTVPVVERVGNDQLRDAMDENVPSNYNAATPAPKNVTEGTSVAKPCDMGDEDAVKPADPVATPADVDYVPVPGNGITDTNENPVQLVTADVKDASCSEVKVSQYGIASTEGNVTTVQPVGTDGKPVAGADPIQTVTKDGDTTTTETSVKAGSNAITEKAVNDGSGTVTTETTASLNGGATTVEQTETATTNPSTGYTTTKTEGEVKNANGKVVAQTESTETTSPAGNSSTTTDKVTTLDPATGKVTGSTESTTTSQTAANGTVTNTTNGTTKDANGNVTGTFQTTETVAKDENGTVTTQADTTKKDAAGAVTETSSTTTTQDRAADGTLTTAVSGTSTDADGNVTTTNEVTAAKTNPVTGTTTESKTVNNETKDADGNVTASESGTVQTTVQADGSATKTTDMTTTDADGNTTKTETTSTYDADTGKTTTKGTETTTDAGGNTKTETVNATATGDAAGNANTPSEQAAADADSGNSESGNTPSGGGDSGGSSSSVSLTLSAFETDGTDVAMEGSAAGDLFTLDAYTKATSATKLTADGAGGNDTFKVTGDVTTNGGNTVTVELSGGDGNDIFTVSETQAHAFTLDGGAGDDTFEISKNQNGAATVNGGEGKDTFTISAALAAGSALNGDAGDDTFTLSADQTAAFTLDGGAGADTFNLSKALASGQTVAGGAGDDTFAVAADLTNGTLNGGDGNDTFTLTTAQTHVIVVDGGAGDSDTLKISGVTDPVDLTTNGLGLTNVERLDMLDGKANSVTLNNTQATTFLKGGVTGEYDDVVTISDAFTGIIDDLPVSVKLADVSGNQFTINAMNSASITGSTTNADTFILGKDFTAVATDKGTPTLDGGTDQNDELKLDASGLDLSAVTVIDFETLDLNSKDAVTVKADLIAGGHKIGTISHPVAGTVITLSGAANGELANTAATIKLADAANTVKANASGSTIQLGAKADTVTLGAGNDTVKLVAETEADSITGLTVASDKLDVSAITALDGGAFSVVTKSGETYTLTDKYVHTLVDVNAASLNSSAFTLEEGKTALVAAHTAADATTYNMYLVTGGTTPTVASLGTVTADAALTAAVFDRTEDKSGGTLDFNVTGTTLGFTALGTGTEFAIKVADTSKVTVNNTAPAPDAAVTTIDLNGFTTQTVTIAAAADTAGLHGNGATATPLEISNGTATTIVNLTGNQQDTLKINGDSAVVTVSGGLSANDAVSGSFKLYNSTTPTGNADLTVTKGSIALGTSLTVGAETGGTFAGSLAAVRGSATTLAVGSGTVDLHEVTLTDFNALNVNDGATAKLSAEQLKVLTDGTSGNDIAGTGTVLLANDMTPTNLLGSKVTSSFHGTLEGSEGNSMLYVDGGANISGASLINFAQLNISGKAATNAVTISASEFKTLTAADVTTEGSEVNHGITASATDKLTVTGSEALKAEDISDFAGKLTIDTIDKASLAAAKDTTIASVTGDALTALTLDATAAKLTVNELSGASSGLAITVAGNKGVAVTHGGAAGDVVTIAGTADEGNVISYTFKSGDTGTLGITMGTGADAVTLGSTRASVTTATLASGDSYKGAALTGATGETVNLTTADVYTGLQAGDKISLTGRTIASGDITADTTHATTTADEMKLIVGSLEGGVFTVADAYSTANNDYLVEWGNGDTVEALLLENMNAAIKLVGAGDTDVTITAVA